MAYVSNNKTTTNSNSLQNQLHIIFLIWKGHGEIFMHNISLFLQLPQNYEYRLHLDYVESLTLA